MRVGRIMHKSQAINIRVHRAPGKSSAEVRMAAQETDALDGEVVRADDPQDAIFAVAIATITGSTIVGAEINQAGRSPL